jgi:hypothetical protein
MKKFNIYVQDDCDFCKEIEIPKGLDVTKVYINRDDFEGFRPANVPVLQLKTFQLEGPYQINEFLKLVK